MNSFFQIVGRIEVIILMIILVIFLIAWLIFRKITSNKYKKKLADLEVRYNQISSVPLAFKLNKAVAISRVDHEMIKNVSLCKDDFDLATSNLKQISQTLADIEDNILIGKLKDAKSGLLDLESSIKLGEEQVEKLNVFLDSVLEKETEQRSEVTVLKDKFRELKNEAKDKNALLSYSWATIERNITNIEGMFTSFEEWMYASDFEKANLELKEIKTSIYNLEVIVKELPNLLQDARGVIPHMIEETNKLYVSVKNKGVYLNHLNVESNLRAIENNLRTDLEILKKGDAGDAKQHMESYKERLRHLFEQIKKESSSFDDVNKIYKVSNSLIDDAKENCEYVKNQFEKVSVRFGLEDLDSSIKENENKLIELADKKDKVFETISNNEFSASSVIIALKELHTEIQKIDDEFKNMRIKLDSAKSDEERAHKELLKLQLIMNEIQVKIRKNKLPSISNEYEDDLQKAYEYISSINKLVSTTPLEVELLNSTLKGAIDFIWKLYNNVNNIVGMAIMVENTIVFGNKYRSTYPDIDSELTRAELSYRNGEYTQALTIAIATIDKIHPGSYEKLVSANARSSS